MLAAPVFPLLIVSGQWNEQLDLTDPCFHTVPFTGHLCQKLTYVAGINNRPTGGFGNSALQSPILAENLKPCFSSFMQSSGDKRHSRAFSAVFATGTSPCSGPGTGLTQNPPGRDGGARARGEMLGGRSGDALECLGDALGCLGDDRRMLGGCSGDDRRMLGGCSEVLGECSGMLGGCSGDPAPAEPGSAAGPGVRALPGQHPRPSRSRYGPGRPQLPPPPPVPGSALTCVPGWPSRAGGGSTERCSRGRLGTNPLPLPGRGGTGAAVLARPSLAASLPPSLPLSLCASSLGGAGSGRAGSRERVLGCSIPGCPAHPRTGRPLPARLSPAVCTGVRPAGSAAPGMGPGAAVGHAAAEILQPLGCQAHPQTPES